jgi:hypothetical protein
VMLMLLGVLVALHFGWRVAGDVFWFHLVLQHVLQQRIRLMCVSHDWARIYAEAAVHDVRLLLHRTVCLQLFFSAPYCARDCVASIKVSCRMAVGSWPCVRPRVLFLLLPNECHWLPKRTIFFQSVTSIM